MHPLVRELVALLPTDGNPFPEPARKRWVVAIEAAFELLYGEGDDDQPPARARHRALPTTEVDLRDPDLADYHGESQRQLTDYGMQYAGDYPNEYAAAGSAEFLPDYPADYRADSPEARVEPDADAPADGSWRPAGDRAIGSTYSSYMWDTASP